MKNKRRSCADVILQMLSIIPDDQSELISDLQWNYNDSLYKAPEETLQWQRTMHTLQKHIQHPMLEWEFEVLSIFTTKSVDELKKMVLHA